MIYKSENDEYLCFKHAVLRVSLRGEDIYEESSIPYRAGCVDCIANKRALSGLGGTPTSEEN